MFYRRQRRLSVRQWQPSTAWLALWSLAVMTSGCCLPTPAAELRNAAFQLTVTVERGAVEAGLVMRQANWRAAEGACLYRAERLGPQGPTVALGLEQASVAVTPAGLTIRGLLAGLEVEHRFTAPPDRPILEERLRLRNRSAAVVELRDFAAGFPQRVTDPQGRVLPELAGDRWVAVPLRVRANDPKGQVHDFSIGELVTNPVHQPRLEQHLPPARDPVPARRYSEGWAWTHNDTSLGIFAFSQEHVRWSVVSTEQQPAGVALRFGGAAMIDGEPSALTRIAPGQTVDLGIVRYQAIPGGYAEAEYAFRAMLDENGCRFPKGYNPPVHWEQLYDMEGAWDDRPHRYTKAVLEHEARKGVAYGCEALYLDPGWDTAFGTFLWGEPWLGPRRRFIQEVQANFGLKVALHCPLATWAGAVNLAMGPPGWESWPAESRRRPPAEEGTRAVDRAAPAVRDGRRNLALMPQATARASSTLAGYAIHKVEHLNDGWRGNRASWIAGDLPAWAEVDLGEDCRISEVRLGNDHALEYSDRALSKLRLLTTTNRAASSEAFAWRTVADYKGEPLGAEKVFTFAPVLARCVRVELLRSEGGLPRLDEIEVYEAEAPDPAIAAAFREKARRGPPPAPPDPGLRLCLGAKAYLAEAERRLLASCADGAVFLMFDGNWWNGGCADPAHGHPVPYRKADHLGANLDLARRVHAAYPNVLIEMHDMLAGGSTARLTPVYYGYGLPGSYDENWGFELMWNPLDDLKQGRAASLYYYNLGCNVPIYLHIDLRKDNEQCVVLWWYASTCRHLGIGGTSPNPAVVAAQQQAMRRYRAWDRFFKRGEFYGINEEIHLHVLPSEQAFVVNVFNLSDQPRTITGAMALAACGLKPDRAYAGGDQLGAVRAGRLTVQIELPPWAARAAHFAGTPE